MKRVIIIAALALLALPVSAQAWSIHNYRVRDAGPEIVHKLTLCTQVASGYEQRFHFTAYSEAADGSDAGQVRRVDWFSRGCWRYSIVHNDDLEFLGTYHGSREGEARTHGRHPLHVLATFPELVITEPQGHIPEN